MKNFIKLGDKEIDLDSIKTDEDLNAITSACVSILGVTLVVGTSALAGNDKERTEKILKFAGEIGAAAAKQALVVIANTERLPEEEETSGNHNA